MITVEECLLFAEWLAERYLKTPSGWKKTGWIRKDDSDKYPTYLLAVYTTRELWELYQQFLGKKTTK